MSSILSVVAVTMVILSIIIFVVDKLAFRYILSGGKATNPHEKLNTIIDEECDKFAKAQEALLAGEQYVRHLSLCKDQTMTDIAALKRKIKIALVKNDDIKARDLTEELISREHELSDRTSRLAEAVSQHQQSARIVSQFQRRIRKLRQDANELKIREGFANAEQNAAALAMSLETGIDTTGYEHVKNEIESNIAAAKASAEIDNQLIQRPGNEFLSGENSDENSVENRLQQLKQEMIRLKQLN